MGLDLFLVVLGVLFLVIGGWLDIAKPCACGTNCPVCKKIGCNHCRSCSMKNNRFLGLSKMHYWIDGLALLLFAVLLRC